jgi:hypothetical protein
MKTKKDRVADLTLAQIVAAVSAAIIALFAVLWASVPSTVWNAVPKRAIWATLGLATMAALVFAALFIREKRRARLIPLFGVLWNPRHREAYCPADLSLLRILEKKTERDHDILMCPKCEVKYPLRTDDLQPLTFSLAKQMLAH